MSENAQKDAAPGVLRIGMTLDIQEGKLDEYIAHHAQERPEVVEALRSVGMRNLRCAYVFFHHPPWMHLPNSFEY